MEIAPLLNLKEIERDFGLYDRQVYAMADLGLIHTYQPYGRRLYARWEIEQALRAVREAFSNSSLRVLAVA